MTLRGELTIRLCTFLIVFAAGNGRLQAQPSWRDLVEDEWRRHDEERLREIRQPGTVRFAQSEVRWPGVGASRHLHVPLAAAPRLDGILGDPCWKDALAAAPPAIRRRGETTTVEIILPLGERGALPRSVTVASGQVLPLRLGGAWKIRCREEPLLGFGRNHIALEISAPGALDPPVETTIETAIFTARNLERRTFAGPAFREPGSLDAEFEIAGEGAAAVTLTARQGEVAWCENRVVFVPPVEETLERARRLIEDFGLAPPAELAGLRERAAAIREREQARGPDPAARAKLSFDARWLAREIAFQNPLLDLGGLLFVKRYTQQTYPDVCLNHMPWVSRPGGDICLLSPVRPDGVVRPLLQGALESAHGN